MRCQSPGSTGPCEMLPLILFGAHSMTEGPGRWAVRVLGARSKCGEAAISRRSGTVVLRIYRSSDAAGWCGSPYAVSTGMVHAVAQVCHFDNR